LILKARLKVTCGDKAFAKVNTAVLFTAANLILDLNLEWLSFNTLKAVEGTCSLLLCACVDVKGSDKALTIVNAAVLLADTLILGNLDSSLSTLAFQAVEGASSF
jgi:hypothetical protein